MIDVATKNHTQTHYQNVNGKSFESRSSIAKINKKNKPKTLNIAFISFVKRLGYEYAHWFRILKDKTRIATLWKSILCVSIVELMADVWNKIYRRKFIISFHSFIYVFSIRTLIKIMSMNNILLIVNTFIFYLRRLCPVSMPARFQSPFI